MSELPPTAEILDALKFAVAPAAGATVATAAALCGIVSVVWSDWRKLAPVIAVVAVAAGLWAGNSFRGVFPTTLPSAIDGKPWHWAWWAFALALLVELVARFPGVEVSAGNLFRGAAAGVIAAFVVPTQVQDEAKWWVPAFAFAVAVQWAVVDAVGRRNPGGWTAAAVASACGGAAAVLIHAESAGFTDVTTFLLTGLATLAVLAWVTGADVGSAAAVATVPVCVLLLLGRHLRDSEVSNGTFLLAAFAPVVLGAFLLPPVSRLNGKPLGGVLQVVAVSIPVTWAVLRVMAEAPLTFGEKW